MLLCNVRSLIFLTQLFSLFYEGGSSVDADSSPQMCNDLFCDYVAVDESIGNSLLSAIETITSAPNDYRHYLWFLQSSGYGKTKRCMELMKTYKACYVLCESIEGGFKENVIVEMLKTNARSEYIKKVLQQIQQMMAEKDATNLFESQFPNNVYDVNFLNDNITITVSEADVHNHPLQVSDQFTIDSDHSVVNNNNNNNNNIDNQTTVEADVHNHPLQVSDQFTFDSDHSVVNNNNNNIDNQTTVEADVDNHPPQVSDQFFLLIFDEAHNLGTDLMKALKLELDNFHMIGICLSTNGHLNTMNPTAQSLRTTPRNYVQPVTLLYTFDLYISLRYRSLIVVVVVVVNDGMVGVNRKLITNVW